MLFKKWWQFLIVLPLVLGLVLAALAGLAATLIYPTLPSLEALTDYRPKVPLRVYSADGHLIGEFGEERRAFIRIQDVPQSLKQAILAAEDERFYEHGGIDTIGIARAAVANIIAGGFKEGASTITMQVARNFFLSSEKTATRKLSEALLAIKIEHSLSKDQILELYVNQIYLGQRSYGFGAAAQVYYGKPLANCSVAEVAMLAGLPKAPSRYNPFVNPKRAEARQHYVLGRMHTLKFIDDQTYQAALSEPSKVKKQRSVHELSADYVAEIARRAMYERYQDAIYSSGMRVYTTILKTNQEAANRAVIQGIVDFERRRGFRGPEKRLSTELLTTADDTVLEEALDEFEQFNGLIPAIVTKIDTKTVHLYAKNTGQVEIKGDGLSLVSSDMALKDAKKRKFVTGAVVRIYGSEDNWQITQLPEVESALIALDPKTGAVQALVGGFNFNRNKFNHVTQAWRQPGSSFKPFIYSAALEKGFTPATMVADEPVYISSDETGSGKSWEPRNFDGKYDGPIKLRTALTKSKNMVSIRILQDIGIDYARDYITRFGFSAKDHPPYLAMALGSGSVTPWQMAGGYAVFANGGYQIQPHIISKIVDSKGKVIQQAKVTVAGKNAKQVIDGRNAFLMSSLMQDVVRVGTAARANQLGRNDLAGKTGTTNDMFDAWFAGYSPAQVAVAWMGYDKPKSLGHNETGGRAALPIWINYMSTALKGEPDKPYIPPEGIAAIKINPDTGMRVAENQPGFYEYFYQEFPPEEEIPLLDPGFSPFPGHSSGSNQPPAGAKSGQESFFDQLF
ncbi:MAG: penicillin-binding protein [Betaproteobacteria bacterium HGW-Betaproteobacteria-8]|nr:MAG: penicillin-binding protein [Betaproteobacteria bacterium HGW-Betaproteobacteria-8]